MDPESVLVWVFMSLDLDLILHLVQSQVASDVLLSFTLHKAARWQIQVRCVCAHGLEVYKLRQNEVLSIW